MDVADLTIQRGQAAQLSWVRSTGTQNAGGWATVFTVRKRKSDTSFVIQITGLSVSQTNTPGDTLSTTVTAAQNTIAPGLYYWDLWRTDPGTEDPLASGQYIVKADVRVPLVGS